MKFITTLILLLALLTFSAEAQTNEFYSAKQITVSASPTISFPNGKADLYGVSVMTLYWQTDNTATGMELGKRDVTKATSGFVDHISIVEAYRIVPFKGPISGRFALTAFTGAESWFDDGTKGVEIGVIQEVAVSKTWRIFGRASQHFETTQGKSGNELTIGITRVF